MTTKTIGEFELFMDRLIGKGAWGEVYHGRQISLDRPVAVKILKKELTQDEQFVKRFLREAKTLAKLTDQHIIHVYSAGQHEGAYYFIMEYVEGQPLSDLIERGSKFTVEETIHVADSVAQALKSAWESPAKIVHRDIKPSNIMVSSSGSSVTAPDTKDVATDILKARIKVMDFGLAKASEGGKDATMAGTVIGTPKYISPEQGLGNPADIRSDIYSLGIVMYEMATGRIPFQGESAVSMIRQHVHDDAPPPSQFNQAIPKDLETVIMKCIRKEPEQRYAHPDQLIEDLAAIKQNRALTHASSKALEATIISDIEPGKKKTHAVFYAALVGLVIAAGLTLYILNLPQHSPSSASNNTNDQIPVVTAPATEPITQPAHASTTLPPVDQPEEAFQVKVWTDKGKNAVYAEDEIIKFHFQANKDGYIYLYHKDAAGQVSLLFPNGYNKNNRVEANRVYTIPDQTMNFDIKVAPPFGLEQVKVVASLQPIKDLDIKPGEEGFRDLGQVKDINETKLITRSLQTVPKEARTEDICTLTTTERITDIEPEEPPHEHDQD